MPKGMCPAEVMSNSEIIKPVALAVIELRLSEGISQSVSQSFTHDQSVSQSLTRKFCLIIFHSNLLKVLQVNLKACLGLVLPNQYCFIVIREK